MDARRLTICHPEERQRLTCHPEERQRLTCHPEERQRRGIFCAVLVACYEIRMQDPSLTLGMTTELTLGMTTELTLGMTRGDEMIRAGWQLSRRRRVSNTIEARRSATTIPS